jgi:hypothetical protein
VFGRDGRAGGSNVLVEVPLLVAVIVGNAAVVDEGVVAFAVAHQLCRRRRAREVLTCATSSFPRLRRRDCAHLGRDHIT